MDHASISQDREDLECYRQGKPIPIRKEYKATIIPIKKIIEDSMKILEQKLKRVK